MADPDYYKMWDEAFVRPFLVGSGWTELNDGAWGAPNGGDPVTMKEAYRVEFLSAVEDAEREDVWGQNSAEAARIFDLTGAYLEGLGQITGEQHLNAKVTAVRVGAAISMILNFVRRIAEEQYGNSPVVGELAARVALLEATTEEWKLQKARRSRGDYG